MTNISLAQSYLKKATDRLAILTLLLNKKAYSDVVRESQEIVELTVKAMLRSVGIEPPKFHDVGGLLIEHRKKFKKIHLNYLKRIAAISKALRKERELSFYGDIDFIPTEEYTLQDAKKAIKDTTFTLNIAKRVIK